MYSSVMASRVKGLAAGRRSWQDSGLARMIHGVMVVRRRLAIWGQRYRTRQVLARMDDRLLKDIGLSRTEALQESDKPFWRP